VFLSCSLLFTMPLRVIDDKNVLDHGCLTLGGLLAIGHISFLLVMIPVLFVECAEHRQCHTRTWLFQLFLGAVFHMGFGVVVWAVLPMVRCFFGQQPIKDYGVKVVSIASALLSIYAILHHYHTLSTLLSI